MAGCGRGRGDLGLGGLGLGGLRLGGPAAALALALLAAGCSADGAGSPPTALTSPAFTAATAAGDHIDLTAMTFAIEPFEGMPGNAADDLTRRIVETGKHEGLTFVQRLGAPATYRVRGWLTAVGNPTSTTVVYIYDVTDASGQRVFRFTGQEPSGGTSADPWSAVSVDTISIIAERTVASLKAWLARGSG